MADEREDIDNMREAREALVSSLKHRLAGPDGGADEIVEEDRPSNLYIAGVLAPIDTSVEGSEDDPLARAGDDGDEGRVDEGVSAALSNGRLPSSFGLTCIVDGDVESLECSFRGARYKELGVEEGEGEQSGGQGNGEETGPEPPVADPPDGGGRDGSTADDGDAEDRRAWKRDPVGPEKFTLDIPSDPRGTGVHEARSDENLAIRWVVRPARGSGSARILTVALVNEERADHEREFIDEDKYLFQAGLKLEAPGERRPFLRRSLASETSDSEERNLELLYRDRPAFASGHGCAADWTDVAADRAGGVETSAIPTYELPVVRQAGEQGEFLSPEWLAEAPPTQLEAELGDFVDAYGEWIALQEEEVDELPEHLEETARKNISNCRTSAERMREGVSLLVEDETVLEAFRLMNRALVVQLEASDDDPSGFRWYPFQLGFILQGIRGATTDTAQEDPVDVLWFPTGGGKTEAYLGLAALTICHRRLTSEGALGGAGVTVLMRYTLRLLTIQQFQRAASMICALERLRRTTDHALGEAEISIGLWVGKNSTPLHVSNAVEMLEQGDTSTGSPVQLEECPHCGSELGEFCYRPTHDESGIDIVCPDDGCPFGDGLPVSVVDEQVYRECPTLVIGTVDKFARLPWVEDTKSLFGIVDHWCPDHGFGRGSSCGVAGCREPTRDIGGLDPPSLVIQDELHLISGPLGTMVGVYEGLIDFLCRRNGRAPQIVGSSATVRKAGAQVRNLYGREVSIFPPRALHADNTFFSERIPLEEEPGRLYVGVHPAGKSMKTSLVRIYGSFIADTHGDGLLPPIDSREGRRLRDPYWTIVGYYNSLRELGGALRLVEDDIPGYLNVIMDGDAPELVKKELTSRRTGAEIPKILQQMENSLRDRDEMDVLDAVLATNMISVGVDVQRLGLMVVTGQPKSTAEYIQATSRVGRRHPGIVVSLYNWSRPRDKSHYEDFRDYHATMYRHVEANSVTPHTRPALERGLHALLVAAVRLLEPGMGPSAAAGDFQPDLPTVENLLDFLTRRLRDPRDPEAGRRKIEEYYRAAVDTWAERARLAQQRNEKLMYAHRDKPSLLVSFEDATGTRDPTGMPTLNSLRNVEPEVAIRLKRTGVGD